ncbi:7TM-DISM domain-containing protein, partial [uncultured Marinobacter sp.]|uniref:7TMR-DISM family protein n=1 Tax=uncultured Marinobacter sp. TaxID=187379 RepID=UPI002587F31A
MGFQWLEVPDGSLGIDGVRSLPKERWQAHEADTVLNLGFSDGTFWLRVEVPPEPRNRLLQVGYPLLDEVSVYWEQAGNIVETWHTGDTLPFRSRPIEHRTFVFLVPSNTEPVTAWVRVKTQGSIQIPVKVTPSAEFHAYEQIAYGWQAMFVGVVVALALYNLFLFAIVRYPTYLWYVLTVLSAGLVQLNFNGLLFQWFWPNLPVINQYLTAPLVALGLSLAFGLLDVVNIAHPVFVILGSYVAFMLYEGLGIDPIVAGLIFTPVFYLLGVGVYRIYYNSFEKKGTESL